MGERHLSYLCTEPIVSSMLLVDISFDNVSVVSSNETQYFNTMSCDDSPIEMPSTQSGVKTLGHLNDLLSKFLNIASNRFEALRIVT